MLSRPPIWSRSSVPCPVWDQAPEAVQVQRVAALLENDPEISDVLNSRDGVTDGSVAAPGVIAQVLTLEGSVQVPAFSLSQPWDTICPTTPALPAGDWLLWASAVWQRAYPGVHFYLPATPGITGNLAGGFWGGPTATSMVAAGVPGHGSRTGTIGLVFNVHVNPGAGTFTTAPFTMQVQALRLR